MFVCYFICLGFLGGYLLGFWVVVVFLACTCVCLFVLFVFVGDWGGEGGLVIFVVIVVFLNKYSCVPKHFYLVCSKIGRLW